jgi:LuxR family maltose regulon positive regulatory protein
VACLAHLGFTATAQSLALSRQRCENAIALAAKHGWDAEPVIAPAQATLAGTLVWTGEFDRGEQWLARARRATQSDGEPGIRLLVHLVSAVLPAARGQHRDALAEFAAAGQVQARMAGEHSLTSWVIAWTIATQARLGEVKHARATLAALDDRLATVGEIRNAAAVIRLAEQDPAGARRELRAVLDGGPVKPHLTLVEAHLLDALAWRDLGDERAVRTAVEHALDLAEPDRLILPTNLTRPEIAGELSISLNTVSTHIRRIYAKLGATDRSSAVQRGRELRLLSGRA